MKVIKDIAKNVQEEIHDADKYAWLAVRSKADHPELADLYSRLANGEIEHANMLHKQAVDIIERYRREGHEPPVAMKAVWDWEHERYIEEMADVRRVLDMYRS